MAFDEWLLGRALATPGWTALRLYTWARPTITFGVNQRAESALDFARLGNTPAIRRVTGGRALLHQRSELTYCVVTRPPGTGETDRRWSRSIGAAHAAVAEGLVAFLKSLGIESNYAHTSSRENSRRDFFHKAPCFASHARHEVFGPHGKVVASAARRLEGAILMHGAIKIAGVADHPALPLAGVDRASAQVDTAVSDKRFAEFCDRFGSALGFALGVSVAAAELRPSESEQILRAAEFVRKNELARRTIFEQIAL